MQPAANQPPDGIDFDEAMQRHAFYRSASAAVDRLMDRADTLEARGVEYLRAARGLRRLAGEIVDQAIEVARLEDTAP